jgi:hypothetical protein
MPSRPRSDRRSRCRRGRTGPHLLSPRSTCGRRLRGLSRRASRLLPSALHPNRSASQATAAVHYRCITSAAFGGFPQQGGRRESACLSQMTRFSRRIRLTVPAKRKAPETGLFLWTGRARLCEEPADGALAPELTSGVLCGAPRSRVDDTRKPRSHCGSDSVDVRLQAVVTRDVNDDTTVGRWRHSEWITVSLDDEHRHRDGVELVQAVLLRAAGRVYRKREAEHRRRACRFRRAAGDAGSERPPAHNQWEVSQRARTQVVDHSRPRRVELARRGRRAASRDAVRLLNERDAYVLVERDVSGSCEVGRPDATGCSVAEDKRAARFGGSVDVRPRCSVGRGNVNRRHALDRRSFGLGGLGKFRNR